MSRKLTAAFLLAAASLAGCTISLYDRALKPPPRIGPEDPLALKPRKEPVPVVEPRFYFKPDHEHGGTLLTPQGTGWMPNSEIEIYLFGEPKRNVDGELYTEYFQFRGTVRLFSDGWFGLNSGALKIWVPRLCGDPPPGFGDPFLMAIDRGNDLLRFTSVDIETWFTTSAPCS